MLHTLLTQLYTYAMPFLFINLLFIALYLFSEVLYLEHTKHGKNPEILRKGFHASAAIVFFLATFLLPRELFLFVVIEAFIALIASRNLNILHTVHKTRKEHENLGIYFYVIGIFINAYFFYATYGPSQIEILRTSILILGIADMAASIAGTSFPKGKYSIGKANKTLIGSVAFICTTLAIILASSDYSNIPLYILVTLNLTELEAVSFNGVDNLLIMIFTPIFLMLSLYQNFLFLGIMAVFIGIYAKYTYNNKR